ncbi:hypothetical protein [Streptomyces scopuliridis]|uniref:hypothetical protein n=1 Tax=Streptomyces scopuliridis TaxID=452529 RepID=UPI0035D70710
MRGLREPGRPGGFAVGTALTALAAVGLLVSGCSTGGTGTRDEGAAVTSPVERGAPTPAASASAPAKTVNAVALLRKDPLVSPRVKADLQPCGEDTYPVDTSYGNLTGGTAPDLVINVMTCADSVGVGTYVYRQRNEEYQNVFAAEEPAVYATIDRGELVVTQQVYAKGDPLSFPSGEDVVTYSWADTKFSERYRVRNDYSRAAGGDGSSVPDYSPSEN